MIETLTNLKNNKSKRNITQNQGGAAVERMKKFLSGLRKTHRGGDPLVYKQAQFTKTSVSNEEMIADEDSNGLVKLARAQGMNTDIRRGIFVVLMSSDVLVFPPSLVIRLILYYQDYIDACERLSQLSLTEVQQREIIRVLLHCCGNVCFLLLSF